MDFNIISQMAHQTVGDNATITVIVMEKTIGAFGTPDVGKVFYTEVSRVDRRVNVQPISQKSKVSVAGVRAQADYHVFDRNQPFLSNNATVQYKDKKYNVMDVRTWDDGQFSKYLLVEKRKQN